MVPMYALLLLALVALKRTLTGRAARFERKYTRAALDAEVLARESQVKPGNGGAADALVVAKRQYALALAVDARDRLEMKFVRWQAKADAVAKLLARLHGWNGRLIPYFAGVVDVGLVFVALNALGMPHGLEPTAVKEWAQAFVK